MRCPDIGQIIKVGTFCVLVSTIGSLDAFASSYQDAFADRLSNPNDTHTLNQFVNVAVEAGQYDQALSTIEQHLITYPRDAHARLIAGRLYNHVGSYELAKRQIEHALSIGTLQPDEQSEAEKLIERIDRNLSGTTGFVAIKTGLDVVRNDYDPTAAVSDRTDVNPYAELYATLRHSLESPTDDAIVLTARTRIARRFGDYNLSGSGGVFTASSGRVAIAWEKGLPDTGISSLRMSLSAYGDYYEFQQDSAIREYGITANFSAKPSVDTTVYTNLGYANLATSDLLFTDHRWRAEIGGAHRISGKHAIGAKVRGQFDYANDGTFVGQSIEGIVSYAGLLWSDPDGITWTHRASVGGGHVELPDLLATPGTTFDGTFWSASWDHTFEINDQNRIDLTTYYRAFNLDDPSRDQTTYGIGLSYTYTFR